MTYGKLQADWDKIDLLIEIFNKFIFEASVEYKSSIYKHARDSIQLVSAGEKLFIWEDTKKSEKKDNVVVLKMITKTFKTIYINVGK